MQKKAVYAAVGVAIVVVAIVIWITTVSEDEGPIIVKNGSMVIDTDGAWQEDGGAWSNETGKDHKGDLWVRVNLQGGTKCAGSGRPVHVEYSVGGFNAIFNVAGNPARTKVSPKGQLVADGAQRLRHGAAGGYITGVRIGGTALSCGITQNNLEAINICSSRDVTDCQ